MMVGIHLWYWLKKMPVELVENQIDGHKQKYMELES